MIGVKSKPPMGGKNFTNLFKGEKDYYELVKYD